MTDAELLRKWREDANGMKEQLQHLRAERAQGKPVDEEFLEGLPDDINEIEEAMAKLESRMDD